MTSSFERQLNELRGRYQALEAKLEEHARRLEALESAAAKAPAPDAGVTKGQPSDWASEGRADVPPAILDA